MIGVLLSLPERYYHGPAVCVSMCIDYEDLIEESSSKRVMKDENKRNPEEKKLVGS